AHPPDTHTPMLEYETPLRPKATEEIAGGAGVWEPHQVALAIIKGAQKGRFLIVPGIPLILFSFLHSLIAPAFRGYQGWIVTRCGRLNQRISGQDVSVVVVVERAEMAEILVVCRNHLASCTRSQVLCHGQTPRR